MWDPGVYRGAPCLVQITQLEVHQAGCSSQLRGSQNTVRISTHFSREANGSCGEEAIKPAPPELRQKKKSCNLSPWPLRPGGLRSSAPRSAGNGPAPLCAQARAAPGAHGHLARVAPASLAGKHGSVDSGWGFPGRQTRVPAGVASTGVLRAPPQVLSQFLPHWPRAGEVALQYQGWALPLGAA